jgi:predicted amidohydrolase
MYRTVRVAALSIKPKKWDKPANADKLEAYVRQAARQAPELIVAPEGFLEGYVVMDVVAHPEKAALMHEIAEPRDGPYVRRFRRLARELRVNLCFGFAERVGREVYNCAAFIGPDGQIRGTYHKTYFAEGTHPTWSFNRIGTKLRAFDTALGRAGIVICADRANPLISRTLVLDGAQFILIPSYGSRKKWQNEAVLARGRENGVPVVQANVGVNLIVSKGEVVAYKWGVDQITSAEIEVPMPPSPAGARQAERTYLAERGPEMARRYRRMMARLAKATNDR